MSQAAELRRQPPFIALSSRRDSGSARVTPDRTSHRPAPLRGRMQSRRAASASPCLILQLRALPSAARLPFLPAAVLVARGVAQPASQLTRGTPVSMAACRLLLALAGCDRFPATPSRPLSHVLSPTAGPRRYPDPVLRFQHRDAAPVRRQPCSPSFITLARVRPPTRAAAGCAAPTLAAGISAAPTAYPDPQVNASRGEPLQWRQGFGNRLTKALQVGTRR